jgi:hypothetical protein
MFFLYTFNNDVIFKIIIGLVIGIILKVTIVSIKKWCDF